MNRDDFMNHIQREIVCSLVLGNSSSVSTYEMTCGDLLRIARLASSEAYLYLKQEGIDLNNITGKQKESLLAAEDARKFVPKADDPRI